MDSKPSDCRLYLPDFGPSDTEANDTAFPLVPLVPHTHGPACSFWPTPTASSWGATGSRGIIRRRIADGTLTEREAQWLVNGNNGRKNPEWTEWLMGFPIGWTEIAPSETPSCLPSPESLENGC